MPKTTDTFMKLWQNDNLFVPKQKEQLTCNKSYSIEGLFRTVECCRNIKLYTKLINIHLSHINPHIMQLTLNLPYISANS